MPADQRRVGRAQQGSEEARLPLRRQHDHLRAHAGDRHGERSPHQLLPLQAVQGAGEARSRLQPASGSFRHQPLHARRRPRRFGAARRAASRSAGAISSSNCQGGFAITRPEPFKPERRIRGPHAQLQPQAACATRSSAAPRATAAPRVPALIGYQSANTPFGQRRQAEPQRALRLARIRCRIRRADRSAPGRDSRAAADRFSAPRSRRRRRPTTPRRPRVDCSAPALRRFAARPARCDRRRAVRRSASSGEPG